MHTPVTPHEHVKRVLHAYDCQRALGLDDRAAIDVTAAQLGTPRQTIIRALALRPPAAAQLKLVA